MSKQISENISITKTRYVNGILLIICLAGLWLRLIPVHHSLWLDELATSWVVSDGINQVWERSLFNNVSPFYFYIEYISVQLFGFNEFGLRLPSLIAGMIMILLVFKIIQLLTQSNISALIAALLVALDAKMIYYSIEVRSYAIATLLVLIMVFYFIKTYHQNYNVKQVVVFGLLIGCLIWVHYLAAIFAICFFAVICFKIFKQNGFNKYAFLLAGALAIVPVLMTLPVIEQFMYVNNNKELFGSYIQPPGLDDIFTTIPHLKYYLLLPLSLFVLTWVVNSIRKQNIAPNKLPQVLLVMFTLLPIGITFLLAFSGTLQIFIIRYIAWFLPLIILLSVYFVAAVPNRYLQVLSLGLLLLFSQVYFSDAIIPKLLNTDFKKELTILLTPEQNTNDWKEVVQLVNDTATNPDKIYVKAGLIEAKSIDFNATIDPVLKAYLLSPVNSLYALKPELADKATPFYDVKKIAPQEGNYWVIGKLMDWDARYIAAKGQVFTLPDCNIQIYFVPAVHTN